MAGCPTGVTGSGLTALWVPAVGVFGVMNEPVLSTVVLKNSFILLTVSSISAR